MAKVEWSRVAADDVEHLVAILLCRENPAARRRRPSRGDGGIDVLVPDSEVPGAVRVYQVKSFATNLTSSQKGQIERSFRRLLDFTRQRDMRVTAWYLTLPLDATDENEAWLAEKTAGVDFPREWCGLNFLDGLAGTYPEVIDYYLHDGADRLAATVRAVAEGLGLVKRAQAAASGDAALQPVDVVDGLSSLHKALNAQDPHYRYDYAVDTVRPDVPDQPGLVAAVQQADADRCVTFKVFARFDEAVVERPVPLRFTIEVEPGSEMEQRLEDFYKYGAPLVSPPGTVSGEADLPGGLGGSFEGGSLTVGPARSPGAPGYDLRVQVLAEDGEVLAETLLHMQPPSVGVGGRGLYGRGEEQHGAFLLESRFDLDTGEWHMKATLSPTRLVGAPPSRLLPGLSLLANFRPPHRLRFAAPFGPVTHPSDPIPEGFEIAQDAGDVYDVVESLATIQEHTTVQVRVPDLTQLTKRAAGEWAAAARLVRGETVTVNWSTLKVHLQPGVRVDEGHPIQVAYRDRLRVQIADQKVALGLREVYLPAAQPGRQEQHDDHADVIFVPFGSDLATLRYLGPEEGPG